MCSLASSRPICISSFRYTSTRKDIYCVTVCQVICYPSLLLFPVPLLVLSLLTCLTSPSLLHSSVFLLQLYILIYFLSLPFNILHRPFHLGIHLLTSFASHFLSFLFVFFLLYFFFFLLCYSFLFLFFTITFLSSSSSPSLQSFFFKRFLQFSHCSSLLLQPSAPLFPLPSYISHHLSHSVSSWFPCILCHFFRAPQTPYNT